MSGNVLPWAKICEVDAAALDALTAWALEPMRSWPQLTDLTKPQRIWDVPKGVTAPIVDRVLDEFGPLVCARDVCLSRVRARTSHGMHVDSRASDHQSSVLVRVGGGGREGPLREGVGLLLRHPDPARLRKRGQGGEDSPVL